ncbi:zinc ribbon domain-containing protein [Oscillospiraceae bacterium 44-5]
MKSCPHCSASIHEKASFCPCCARTVNLRTEAYSPWRMPRRALYSALASLLILALAVAGWLYTRPKVYDNGAAEVIYTNGGTAYRVLAGWINDRFNPAHQVNQPADVGDMLYTFPQCLYINRMENSTNAKEEFMDQVKQVTAAFIETENEELPWYCDEPVPREDYAPDAALVSSIHFYAGSGQGTLRWTIEMKNGDVIRLYQTMQAQPMELYLFTPENTPLNTVEEVQALLDSLDVITEGSHMNTVEIHLPPVTYDGGITIPRGVNLYGAGEEEGRTVFTGPVRITGQATGVSWLYDLDFVGGGEGVGFSSSSRVFLQGCRFTGWRTGLLMQDNIASAWNCTFEDNETGIHFNADTGSFMDSRYMEDVFRNNTTAVLLERVPTETAISFPESLFSGNGADIDNRCGQEISIADTIFE